MRTYLISWTYADKLHTFSLHYKITKTSNKTGFTQFCYSFRSHYIFPFGKSQIIFLSFYTHPMFHHICNFQRKPCLNCNLHLPFSLFPYPKSQSTYYYLFRSYHQRTLIISFHTKTPNYPH